MEEQRPQEYVDNLCAFRKHLICRRCQQLLQRPKTLPCLDSFCERCLREDYEQQRERLLQRLGPQEHDEVPENPDNEDVEEDFLESDLEDYRTVPSAGGTSGLLADGTILRKGQDSNYFLCPLEDCDGVTQVSLNDIEELSNLCENIPLSNIGNAVLLKEDLPKGRVLCGVCQEEAAIGVCCNKTCNNRPLCGSCLGVHIQYKQNEKHSIVFPHPPGSSLENENFPVDNEAEDSVKKEWTSLKQTDLFCYLPGHEDCIRNIYCRDHDDVICLRCTALHTHHAGCTNRYAAEDIHPECVDSMKTRLERAEKLHNRFKSALITTAAIKKALEQNVDKVKASILDRYDHLLMQLQNQRDEQLRKAGRVLELKTRELDIHSNMLNRVSSTFSRCIEFVSDFISTAIPSEFMMLKTQINNRLDQLVNTYTNYHRTPLENDRIYLQENSNFDMANAIGWVFSTPSTKKFHVRPLTASPVANQPSYFAVTARDILRTNINLHATFPTLCATIRHVGEQESLEGFISYDRTSGKYIVSVCPSRSGQHEVCIYEPMQPPYNRCYIGGRNQTIVVNVGDGGGPLSFFLPPIP